MGYWSTQILGQYIWLLLCNDLNMMGVPEFLLSSLFILLTPLMYIKRENSGPLSVIDVQSTGSKLLKSEVR